MVLEEYRAKRDFQQTPEPTAQAGRAHGRPHFVVQEHHARRLHYDFRLEVDGVLKSWAVPKEPSLDPSQKRLAVQVEDHPLAYGSFQGTVPAGQYGAGTVTIWDQGTYDNLQADKAEPQSMADGLAAGRLEFRLRGKKLQGRFTLIRMRAGRRGKDNWLLIKNKDEWARPHRPSDPPSARRHGQAKRNPGTPPPTVKETGSPPAADTLALTHTDKILYPDLGLTKGDVLQYYRRVADRLLPYLRDRPATLERLPEGVGNGRKPHFWQKDTPASYPDWIPRIELPTEQGKKVHYVLVNDLPTLLYLVNQGTLTFHVWFSRIGSLDRPDFVLFDLDPGPADFTIVVEVARRLHTLLREEGVQAFLKTSGKSGLHILTPWAGEGGYDEAREWARRRAERLVEALPDRATLEIRKAKRGARVYVDVLQNARGHHAVPPYVLRATPTATVSMPLSWRELTASLEPGKFTLPVALQRIARQKRDPLAGLLPENGG